MYRHIISFYLISSFNPSSQTDIQSLMGELSKLRDQAEPLTSSHLKKSYKECLKLEKALNDLDEKMLACEIVSALEEDNIEDVDSAFRDRSRVFCQGLEQFNGDHPALYSSDMHHLSGSISLTQRQAVRRDRAEGKKLLADTAWSYLDEMHKFTFENLIRLAAMVKEGYQELLANIANGTANYLVAKIPCTVENGFLYGETIDCPLSVNLICARNIYNHQIWRSIQVEEPLVEYGQVGYVSGKRSLTVRFKEDEGRPDVAVYVAREKTSELTFPKFTTHTQFRTMVYDMFRVANIMGHDVVLVNLAPFCSHDALPIGVIEDTFKFIQQVFSHDSNIHEYSLQEVYVKLTFEYMIKRYQQDTMLASIRFG